MAEEKISLEKRFEMLDETIEKLEDKEISLEESFALYKSGMEMLKACNDEIDQVEKQVQLLNDNGETSDF